MDRASASSFTLYIKDEHICGPPCSCLVENLAGFQQGVMRRWTWHFACTQIPCFVTVAFRTRVGMLHLSSQADCSEKVRGKKWGQYSSIQQTSFELLPYARHRAKFLAYNEEWETASLSSWSVSILNIEIKFHWCDIIIITLSTPRYTSKFLF